jgi:hypothetical protein
MLYSVAVASAICFAGQPLTSLAPQLAASRAHLTALESVVTTEAVGEEPPLTGVQRIKRAASFYSKVVPILASYKAVEFAVDRGTMSEEDAETRYEELHDWGSERLEAAIQELKGFYVKTGQVISTRVDLFPEQYTTRLASLQDDLDAMPAEVIKQVVERELLQGEPLDSIFATFDDKPLGSASIAQVHKATLRDGRVVAVKVQRPNCEPKLRGDIVRRAHERAMPTSLRHAHAASPHVHTASTRLLGA